MTQEDRFEMVALLHRQNTTLATHPEVLADLLLVYPQGKQVLGEQVAVAVIHHSRQSTMRAASPEVTPDLL